MSFWVGAKQYGYRYGKIIDEPESKTLKLLLKKIQKKWSKKKFCPPNCDDCCCHSECDLSAWIETKKAELFILPEITHAQREKLTQQGWDERIFTLSPGHKDDLRSETGAMVVTTNLLAWGCERCGRMIDVDGKLRVNGSDLLESDESNEIDDEESEKEFVWWTMAKNTVGKERKIAYWRNLLSECPEPSEKLPLAGKLLDNDKDIEAVPLKTSKEWSPEKENASSIVVPDFAK